MAGPESKPAKKRGGMGARTGLLGLLLAAIGALALWLSNCVPGFGIGGAEGEGDAASSSKAESSTPTKTDEAAPPSAASSTPVIAVGVYGCKLNDEVAQPCADLCKRAEQGEFAGVTAAKVASTQGSHADVTAVIDCLKAAGVSKLAIEKD